MSLLELITQVMISFRLSDCRACDVMLSWTHTHLSLTPCTNNNTSSHLKSAPVCESPFVLMDFTMSTSGVDTETAAARRRQRRLRAYLRYARMSVAVALAESTHHTLGVRAGEFGREMNFTATNRDPLFLLPPLSPPPPPPGVSAQTCFLVVTFCSDPSSRDGFS